MEILPYYCNIKKAFDDAKGLNSANAIPDGAPWGGEGTSPGYYVSRYSFADFMKYGLGYTVPVKIGLDDRINISYGAPYFGGIRLRMGISSTYIIFPAEPNTVSMIYTGYKSNGEPAMVDFNPYLTQDLVGDNYPYSL